MIAYILGLLTIPCIALATGGAYIIVYAYKKKKLENELKGLYNCEN